MRAMADAPASRSTDDPVTTAPRSNGSCEREPRADVIEPEVMLRDESPAQVREVVERRRTIENSLRSPMGVPAPSGE